MISILWALGTLFLGLILYTVEAALGWHYEARTMVNLIPLFIVPLCVVGSLVHAYMRFPGKRTWLPMFVLGFTTSMTAVISVALLFLLIFSIFEPSFGDVMTRNAVNNQLAFSHDAGAGQAMADRLYTDYYPAFQPPLIYMFESAQAAVAGILTSVITPWLIIITAMLKKKV